MDLQAVAVARVQPKIKPNHKAMADGRCITLAGPVANQTHSAPVISPLHITIPLRVLNYFLGNFHRQIKLMVLLN